MYESVSLNHRFLSSCRLMFDCSYDKVKKQIGIAKFKPARGLRENLHTHEGVVFSGKNLSNPIVQTLIKS